MVDKEIGSSSKRQLGQISVFGTSQKCGKKQKNPPSFQVPVTLSEKQRRTERKERFADTLKNGHQKLSTVDPLYKPLSAERTQNVTDPKTLNDTPLVGENLNLEKPYLRLTTFPRKEDVRPLKVLVKALAYIKNRYVQEEDFEWANEQLKSVRQDMTVQRIRNRFVLDVYETHARILLEHGDLDEFNQCQTMIRSLCEGYTDAESMGGACNDETTSSSSSSEKPLSQSSEAADEFRGYAILYALVRNSRFELKAELARAKALHSNGSNVFGGSDQESSRWHAFEVVRSVDDNDYHTFFRLYESAPHMAAYLMDFLLKRVRDQAYERIVSAYRPNVSVEYIRECLRFQDLEETRKFLRHSGAVFVVENSDPPFWVDCKASLANK